MTASSVNNIAKFTPVPMAAAYNRNTMQLTEEDCSPQIIANRQHLLTGDQQLWGIPFQLGQLESSNVLVVRDQSVEWMLETPILEPQLLFLHATDFKETPLQADGLPSPMFGTPRLGETVCVYKLHYEDGSEVAFPMRRRHQISEFQVKWGENSFEAVKHIKPLTMQANTELPAGRAPVIPWGQSQLRVTFQGFDSPMSHWLYALTNPYPNKPITKISFIPADGIAFIFGMTATNLTSNPFQWESRRQIHLKTKPGFIPNSFQPDPNIFLDLGEVISAAPALEYHHADWLNSPFAELPISIANEWIIDYTAHPDARLTIVDQEQTEVIPIRLLVEQPYITAIAERAQRVTIRIIDKENRQPVAAKLHVHAAFGTYLAPINGHRLPNRHWFEDYGAEHVEGNHYSCYVDGISEFKMPLGTVYIEVTKGLEIRPIRKMFTITADTSIIEIELEHILPWRNKGWVTADTHVHFLSPQTALLEGAAEGINVVNLLTSQWGEMFSNLGDFDGKTTIGSKETGGTGEYLVRVGTENRQHVLGHISLIGYKGSMILPLTTDKPDEGALGDPLEASITDWARQCHAQNGIVVLPHLPNPRAEGAASIVLGEIDAIELCSFENIGINPYSLADWYRYLNCGYMVPAVGGTDKMSQETAVGEIRTYALIEDDVFDYEQWMNAVRRGITFATFGPLLEFNVNGQPMGSIIEAGKHGATLDITWQAASATIPITKIELIVNGEVKEIKTVDSTEGLYAGHWSFFMPESGWIALRIRGNYYDQTEIIAAHSSAISVIVNEQRQFKAHDAVTILEQIEGSTAYIRTLGSKANDRTYKQMLLTLTSAHRSLHNRMHQQGVMHRHSSSDHQHEHKHHDHH